MRLDFIDDPHQSNYQVCNFSDSEKVIIDKEIDKLLQKKVISLSNSERSEFISSIITREKKDGSFRMILNLKKLNKIIEYKHFKMESLQEVIESIVPGCYMASVDLKDAFFTIPIYKYDRKFLKFIHRGVLSYTPN